MRGFGKAASSRRGKVVLAIFLASVVVAASAAAYAYIYADPNMAVRSPDVTLAPGTDSSTTCTVYPCAAVTVPSTTDTATVTLSMFKADAAFVPPPSTYYTNLVQVKDSANSHSILTVSVATVSSTTPGDFGSVTVYYCAPQCTFDSSGAVASGTALGSYTFTSATGGTVFSGAQPIASGGTQYVELVAYAGSGATAGDTISFEVAVQWA